MEKIITILHFLLFLINSFYAFLFPKNWFDMYYLLLIFFTALSWTVCKGECIISVLYKKYKDPNYQIGDNQSLDDLTGMFGEEYKSFVGVWIKVIMAIQSYTIYLVLIRNNLSGWYAILFFIYILGLTITSSSLYQGLFFFVFLYILIKIINKVWK